MLKLVQTCSNWSKLVYFRIQEIEEEAFKDLTDLKGLDLSLNIISTVGDTLEPLTNLMKLNLSDNYITSLPRKAFHALEKLSTLDVSNNTIVEIGMDFQYLKQPQNFNSFSRSLEQFFLTVGLNYFGNKIPFPPLQFQSIFFSAI